MKIVKIFLKTLILILTAIWGIIFGIVSPIFLMNSDLSSLTVSGHPVFIIWIIMGVIGYIVPCFLIMLKYYKTGIVFSLAGTVLVIVIHSIFMDLKTGTSETSPSFLYLPQIFMTILTVIIAVAENYKAILNVYSGRKTKHDLPSPSVLKGSDEKKQ